MSEERRQLLLRVAAAEAAAELGHLTLWKVLILAARSEGARKHPRP
jgi:hypothetical protein